MAYLTNNSTITYCIDTEIEKNKKNMESASFSKELFTVTYNKSSGRCNGLDS